MKLTVFFLLATCLHVAAKSGAQTINLNEKDVPIEQVFKKITRQSGYVFFYTDGLLSKTKPVTVVVANATIEQVLSLCFKQLPFTYAIVQKTVVIKEKEEVPGAVRPVVTQFTVQDFSVTGKVTNTNNEPLAGASITEKGTRNVVLTNAEGSFTINLSTPTAVITVSYVGYATSEIEINNRNNLSIALTQINANLSDVVVTGYQTQRKADLTGAISVVSLKEIKDIPSGNPMQALQGRVPGLYIEADGSPSGANRRVLIRGLNTLGDNSPLYIIDGVPTKRPEVFQNLNPNSIQSVQVLKDASAASIYGARASNGVVIVTTKEGKGKDRLQIQFNSSLSVERYTSSVPVLNTEERGRALWQASINDKTDPGVHKALYTYDSHTGTGGVPVLDKVHVTEWLGSPSSLTPAANTNWQDVVFRSGLITSNDVSISVGGEKSSLFMNLGYFNNEGLLRYTDYKRFSGVINSSTSFFGGKLKLGENFQLSKSAETPVPTDLGGQSVLQLAKFLQPIIPVYTTKGDYAGPIGAGFSDRNNPLHMLYINRNDKNHAFNTFGNLYAEAKLIKNLLLRSSFGFDYTDAFSKNIEPAFQEGFLARTVNSLRYEQGHRLNLTFSNTANYQLAIGDSRFNFLLGTEAIREEFLGFNAYREGFAIEDVDYYYLDAGTGRSTNGGNSTGSRLLSYFGKVNFTLSDRYLASATLRRDGSSRFGANNKFAYFPAFTLGWRMNNEAFLRDVTFISDLKLRAGVGRVGNQDIGDIARFGLYRTNYGPTLQSFQAVGTAYDLLGVGTGSLPSGYVSVQAANPNLKWESTDELNLGVDFAFLNNKLSGSFDFFSRKTKDILIQPPYAGVQGEGRNKWVNGATKSNNGFEVVLNYGDEIGPVSYNLNANLGAFQDKITYLPPSVVRSYPGNIEKNILGQSQTALFGYITDGIFQSQTEVEKHAAQPGKGVGRLRYKDLNGDGKIDPLDQDWLGNQLPDFSYGLGGNLSFKNFMLSFFFHGAQGLNAFNSLKSQTDFVGTGSGMNYGKRVLQAWTPQNPGSSIPALSLVNANDETRTSNYFIENASYFKLRNVQLGYSFPRPLIQAIELSEFRVFVLAENLFTVRDTKGLDQFTAPDPENPGNLYPRPMKLTLGVNLSF